MGPRFGGMATACPTLRADSLHGTMTAALFIAWRDRIMVIFASRSRSPHRRFATGPAQPVPTVSLYGAMTAAFCTEGSFETLSVVVP
jgi:hypothetical protein